VRRGAHVAPTTRCAARQASCASAFKEIEKRPRGRLAALVIARPTVVARQARRVVGCAHWTTFGVMREETPRRRVVHGVHGIRGQHAGFLRPGCVLPPCAMHTVGNPCSTRNARRTEGLTCTPLGGEGSHRLACPRRDCLHRWPPDGPHETRSLRGAASPRRATGCCAAPIFTPVRVCERRSVSVPRGLAAPPVIPQLVGVCP